MNKIENALNKIWPWFQSTADKIKAWELPKETEEIFNQTWYLLDDKIKDSLYKFIQNAYDKYGKDYAVQLLAKVLKFLKVKQE